MSITQDRLKQLLSYDPETGVFTRIVGVKGAAAGTVAGCLNKAGYCFIGIDHERPYAHRLAFLYMTGKMPDSQVYHIDQDKTNNCWANLRIVTACINMQNLSKARGKSNRIGVTSNDFGFQARIRHDGQNKYLGTFKSAEEASAAYVTAKRLLHPGNRV